MLKILSLNLNLNNYDNSSNKFKLKDFDYLVNFGK